MGNFVISKWGGGMVELHMIQITRGETVSRDEQWQIDKKWF
jgi:hypothetical protein